MDYISKLLECKGFDWNSANVEKIWSSHKVSPLECEQLFFNQPLIIADDTKHSQKEKRFYALGQTDTRRLLFVVLTLRKNLIRVISARDMSRKERKVYESL